MPRFMLEGTEYLIRETPHFSTIVTRIISRRFGVAAARDREDILERDSPIRIWSGIVQGRTYTIREVEPLPAVASLADLAAEVARRSLALEEAQEERDVAVRAAFAEGSTPSTIAAASGLSLARVYQVRDGRR